jgi:hypothetical protein
MNRERNRKRSKSHKRKKTSSAEKNLDETLLIKMLDERARNNKKVLISKEEFDDLKDCKHMLECIQEDYNTQKEIWIAEQNNFKSAKFMIQQENQELKLRIKEMENKIIILTSNADIGTSDQEINLNKIKESLSNLESLVSYRSTSSKKILLRLHKLLAKHAKILLDQPLTTFYKSKLTVGIRKMSQSLTAVEKLLVSPKDSVEPLVEDQAEVYKLALEKMKNQATMLREKLKELENGDGLKKIIQDQDIKIEILLKERDLLKSQISNLQKSLNDQYHVIENLKTVMVPQKFSKQSSPVSSPEKDFAGFKTYIDHNEKDLQEEIANLDSEIQNLQNSLKRALVNH